MLCTTQGAILLYTFYSVLYKIQYTIYNVLYNAHCTIYCTIDYVVCTIRCTVDSGQYTLYKSIYLVYIVQYTLFIGWPPFLPTAFLTTASLTKRWEQSWSGLLSGLGLGFGLWLGFGLELGLGLGLEMRWSETQWAEK